MTVSTYLGRRSSSRSSPRAEAPEAASLPRQDVEPGGTDVQDLTLSDGNQVWQHVAKLVVELGEDVVGECGLSSIGAVIGATYPRAVSEARRLLPSRSCCCRDRSAGRDAR